MNRLKFFLLGLALLAASTWPSNAASSEADFALHAEKAFQAARHAFQTRSNDLETAWKFGQAAFDRAEFSQNDRQREDLAVQGIAACRAALERDRRSAAAHYYLAMNLGQLARTKSLGALRLVGEMEREFSAALQLDEKFDYAGPDRNLGQLYRDAPGWPTSIGNRGKARQHTLRAVEVAPQFPENHLNLIESLLKWGDKPGALRALHALDELWPKALVEFKGEAWESSWLDWQDRLNKVKARLNEPTATAPHNRK